MLWAVENRHSSPVSPQSESRQLRQSGIHIRDGTRHGSGEESVWLCGSSVQSETQVLLLLDLDLGLPVSTSTIFGLSSIALSNVPESLLL